MGPTSAISLIVGSTIAVLSGGDLQRWAEIASLTAGIVAILCLIAYLLKVSSIVNFISETILLGLKAGAALSIATTQLPKIFGVKGSGSNFFNRLFNLFNELPTTNWVVLCFALVALLLLIGGEKIFPGRPVSLLVVVGSIIVMSVTSLATYGIHITGVIPAGLPDFSRPSLRMKDVDGVLELAFACFLLAYIETISVARTLAIKNNYEIDSRQELISLGAANLAAAFASGYPVSGGLSQSTVNEKAGAKTPLSLLICSVVLGIILLFFTRFLKNLPEVILAVIVIHAIAGLIKIKELKRIYFLSKLEFSVAMIALVGVLCFGILKGVMIAVIMSIILLLRKISNPHVAILGRIGNTDRYSDISRHPDNILYDGVLILRVESSFLYFNAESIHNEIKNLIDQNSSPLKLVVLDLSSSSFVDVAGSKILIQLSQMMKKKEITFKIVGALSNVRDILRMQNMEGLTGHISRRSTIDDEVQDYLQTKTL